MSNLNVNDFVKAVLVENRITPELLSLCSQVLAQPRSLRYDLYDAQLDQPLRLIAQRLLFYA